MGVAFDFFQKIYFKKKFFLKFFGKRTNTTTKSLKPIVLFLPSNGIGIIHGSCMAPIQISKSGSVEGWGQPLKMQMKNRATPPTSPEPSPLQHFQKIHQ